MHRAAIDEAECDSCGATAGHRCVVKNPSPFASKPHKARIDSLMVIRTSQTNSDVLVELFAA
jgi:hypothetical protein